jgi:hypothetical protein
LPLQNPIITLCQPKYSKSFQETTNVSKKRTS